MNQGVEPNRILMLHPSADLYGSDRMLAESAGALSAAGFAVTVAVSQDGPLRELLHSNGAEVVVRPFPVLRKAAMSPRGLVAMAGELPSARRVVTELVREVRPALVYVNTIVLPSVVGFARMAGAQVVVHVHEAEYAQPRPVRTALATPLLAAHALIANSQTTADLLAATIPALSARTRVIYNGVAGPTDAAPARAELTGRVRIVVPGRISARKGTDVAVQALSLLKQRDHEVELTVVGDVFPGNEPFRSQILDLAAQGGVADHVHLVGRQPTVWAALNDHDIVVVPSLGESFGNAAVEAMLARRPLVASRTHGLDEIVRHGENGLLFAPGDATELAHALEQVIAQWPQARARAEAAWIPARTDYGVERYRMQIVDAVNEMINSRNTVEGEERAVIMKSQTPHTAIVPGDGPL